MTKKRKRYRKSPNKHTTGYLIPRIKTRLFLWLKQITSILATLLNNWAQTLKQILSNLLKPKFLLPFITLLVMISFFMYENLPDTIMYQCLSNPFTKNKPRLVVTEFAGKAEGYSWLISSKIEEYLSSTPFSSDFDVIQIKGILPISYEEASDLAKKCNALLLIWGRADQYAVNVYYIVNDPKGHNFGKPLLTESLPNLAKYRIKINESVPREYGYLTLLTIGQFAYFDGRYEMAIGILENAMSTSQEIYEDDLYQSEDIPKPQLRVDLTLFYLGSSYDQSKQRQKAIEAYTAAIQINQYSKPSLLNRGVLYLEMNDLTNAEKDFRKVLEVDSNSAFAHSNLGSTLYLSENYDEARIEFDKALEIAPTIMEAYFSRGLTYLRLEDSESAMIDMKYFLKHSDKSKFKDYRFLAKKFIENPYGPWIIPWDFEFPEYIDSFTY